ncbi:ABC-2 transporter permease, partial [Staphylococcus epidermidis]|uniref:hypothetical protein n=1 Tax=Staphylococcus epidermidis TaxID=1282 RepID=UPI001C92D731
IADPTPTFPIQTTPQFFQPISPYLPFTYSIHPLPETLPTILPHILITKLIILPLFPIPFILLPYSFKPLTHPIIPKIPQKPHQTKLTQ